MSQTEAGRAMREDLHHRKSVLDDYAQDYEAALQDMLRDTFKELGGSKSEADSVYKTYGKKWVDSRIKGLEQPRSEVSMYLLRKQNDVEREPGGYVTTRTEKLLDDARKAIDQDAEDAPEDAAKRFGDRHAAYNDPDAYRKALNWKPRPDPGRSKKVDDLMEKAGLDHNSGNNSENNSDANNSGNNSGNSVSIHADDNQSFADKSRALMLQMYGDSNDKSEAAKQLQQLQENANVLLRKIGAANQSLLETGQTETAESAQLPVAMQKQAAAAMQAYPQIPAAGWYPQQAGMSPFPGYTPAQAIGAYQQQTGGYQLPYDFQPVPMYGSAPFPFAASPASQ